MANVIELEIKELRELQGRIEGHCLDVNDYKIYSALIMNLLDRAEARFARMLAKILAAEADSSSGTVGQEESSHSIDSEIKADNQQQIPATNEPLVNSENAAGNSVEKPESDKDSGRGHGRNGALKFTNSTHIYHELLTGAIGSICAVCKAGTMQRYREKIIIRIVGQPLFGAEVHHCEQARCKICGRIVRASVPDEVTAGIGSSYINYHWSACAMLSVMHYFAGLPFKRLESLHKGWGIPFADANQWNVMNESDGLLLPLFNCIERHGIENGENLRIDDTGSKVISIQKLINAEIESLQAAGKSIDKVRNGINATAAYIETAEGTVTLYYTGLHHAGEIFDRMLTIRRKASKELLIKLTDGASKNFVEIPSNDLVEGVCNGHALLKFRGIKDKFPDEYAIAGAIYKEIFDNDDVAKSKKMTPYERMEYHRKHSLPLMEALKSMCENKIMSKLVEPRSPLWQPIIFIINQWPRLIKFCEVPGVPLDTNLVEQTLIIPVRYLAASFNYQTANGAEVGDRYMSLIVTALDNDVEPVAYLTHCLENHEDLATRPEYYLPWTYRDRLILQKYPSPGFE